MVHILTLISLATSVLGYSIPEISARDGPAPLSFDFTVEKSFRNLSASDFWAQNSARKAKRNGFAEVINNIQDIYYMMNVYLGSNGQKSYVVIDTGSSDLWVPASDYSPNSSTTSRDTGNKFGIQYIDGSISQGEFYLDRLHFESSSPALSSFQFAVANAQGPGVLGIGNRAQEAARSQYDNLPWTLQKAGITPKASYSLYLSPDSGSGVVIFGGVDTEKYEGCLTKYAVHTSGQDLSINLHGFSSGGTTVSINSPYSLDSGTSLGFVGQDLIDEIDVLFNTTVVNEDGVSYRGTSCTQPSDKYVEFDFGGNRIAISYADLIVQNDDGTCFVGLAYFNGYQVLGDVFLRHAYVYFDLTDQTISLAQARNTKSSNIVSA